jgi:hypothetical protein
LISGKRSLFLAETLTDFLTGEAKDAFDLLVEPGGLPRFLPRFIPDSTWLGSLISPFLPYLRTGRPRFLPLTDEGEYCDGTDTFKNACKDNTVTRNLI